MSIPIQNIYYLLSYAWHLLEENDQKPVSGVAGESELNLLAFLLQKYTHLLFKKGLLQQYQRTTKIIPEIKGKLEVTASVQKNLFQQGKASCTFERLSADNLPNQVIKGVLEQVISAPDLSEDLRATLKSQLYKFKEVRKIKVNPDQIRKAASFRFFNPYYRPVLSICELLTQNLLPHAEGEKYYFGSFLEDERQMATLFEAFVRNFYAREQELFRVKSERIAWQLEKPAAANLQYLPIMVTDITFTSSTQNLIMDTKYYKNALRPHYDKQKLISGHLYQLFAYLKNQPKQDKNFPVEGILLYPVVDQELDLVYQLPGHQISIKTINLNQPWPAIKADLLQIIV